MPVYAFTLRIDRLVLRGRHAGEHLVGHVRQRCLGDDTQQRFEVGDAPFFHS